MSPDLAAIVIVSAIFVLWTWIALGRANRFVNKMRDHLAKGCTKHQSSRDDNIFHTVEEAQCDFENHPRSG